MHLAPMIRLRLAIFLTPILLYLAWLLARVLMRRKPSRFDVNVGLSLLVLLYFLAVAGTGIFWVAAQELPVFDWHYLPGYLLVILTLVHVTLNWNHVAAFLRRGAPARLVEPGGRRFKAGIRWSGYGLAGLLGAGIFFILGTRFQTQHFAFSGASEGIVAAGMGAVKEGDPLPSKYLKAPPITRTLAQFYNEGCSYPNRFKLPGLTLEARPPLYKDYPGCPSVALPPPQQTSPMGVLEAYRAWVSGKGAPVDQLTLSQLSTLLYACQGINNAQRMPGTSFDLRTAPSAGALYPVNVYVLAQHVQGLAPGLYYYHPKESALIQVSSRVREEALAQVSGSPESIRSAPATILYTVTFGRTAFKYGERSYRYVNMDTGHAAYNLALCATAMGWHAPLIARFDDARTQALLGLSGGAEAPLLIQAVGGTLDPGTAEPRFLPVPLHAINGSFLDLIHGGTALALGRTVGPRLTFPPMDQPPKHTFRLPEPARGSELLAAIRHRRSVRTDAGTPLPLDQLSALCAASAGYGSAPGFVDPFLSSSAPLDLYLYANEVSGLQRGIYLYHPANHSLELIRAGDFSRECLKYSGQQEFCGAANVVFMKVINWEDMAYPDGDRGYRYACLRAGLMGEGLYLQGSALNLAVCGVGYFEDGSIGKLLGLEPNQEACLYITAVGTR